MSMALRVEERIVESRPVRKSVIAAVDLFCGVGGLSCGLTAGGIEVRAGVDIDAQCRFPFETNNHPAQFVERSVRDLTGIDLKRHFVDSDVTLLAGCAPCQPFSTYSRSSRKEQLNPEDNKWALALEFGRLIGELSPDIVTMENVPQFADTKVFHEFIAMLSAYHVWWDVVDCTRYEVPQTRRRLVVLASRLGPLALIPSTGNHKARTVRDALAHLPRIKAGETAAQDPIHRAARLSKTNLERIRNSKPGGTWRDWDENLRATCHRNDTGKSYPSVYGRMEWDAPSPTITTQCFGFGNGRFGHPEQDRAISLREAALLQTFPSDYVFVRPGEQVHFSTLGRLIGNAVPVALGTAIGRAIRAQIDERSSICARDNVGT